MSTLVKVARYHLVQPFQYLVLTWVVLAFTFVVNVVIFGMTPVGQHMVPTANGLVSVANMDGRYTGALSSFFIIFLVLGVQSIGRSLPFGLALGVSRRSYYVGTALLAVVLACADGLALAALQAIERATGGWGVHMGFFRVPYLLNGPWYLTWLTSFVGLALLFVYGMWFGIVYRRWSLVGTLAFIAAQVDRPARGRACHHLGARLDGRRPLLHRPDRRRADRAARRAGGGPARRRARHHPPRHCLTPVER